MGKPDMTIPGKEAPQHSDFLAWKAQLSRIATFPRVAVKLSGIFSEVDTTTGMSKPDLVAQQVMPWVVAVFEVFGPERVMWASDWPVCNVGYGELDKSFQHRAWWCWRQATKRIMWDLVQQRKLTQQQAEDVWAAVARNVYRLIE